MTKFADPKFSVAVGGKAYADGWERIFGKKDPEPEKPAPPPPDCLECSDTGFVLAEDPQHGHAMRIPCRCREKATR